MSTASLATFTLIEEIIAIILRPSPLGNTRKQ